MGNSKELFNDLATRIQLKETRDEIHSIIFLLLQNRLALSPADILAGKEIETGDPSKWSEVIDRINRHEPIQYILGECGFYGRTFSVNPAVLIPRPETELLVREVIHPFNLSVQSKGIILDIGTGSGCLAVTLAKELPLMDIVATDISKQALEVAAGNAKRHGVSIKFLEADMLKDPIPLHQVTAIVSNPPYIPLQERILMNNNVLQYEPASALFVPDDDPLVFYKAIAVRAKSLLTRSGKAFVEINERFGHEVTAVFKREGFHHVVIKTDMDGKDRIVVAAL
jgi:release factor glutamine methyltransferase